MHDHAIISDADHQQEDRAVDKAGADQFGRPATQHRRDFVCLRTKTDLDG